MVLIVYVAVCLGRREVGIRQGNGQIAAAQVMVGRASADPAATPEPDVRFFADHYCVKLLKTEHAIRYQKFNRNETPPKY